MSVLRKTSVLQLDRLAKRLKSFAAAENGAAAIFFVLSAPVWIGGLALGAEVGGWYVLKQRVQFVADNVASSLAGRIGTTPSQAEIDALAAKVIEWNRFSGDWKVSYSVAPGPVFVSGTRVTVQLKQPVKRYLSKIFNASDFEVEGTASAQVTMATQACILALGYEDGNIFQVGLVPNPDIQLNGCDAHANLSFVISRGSFTSDCLRARFNVVERPPGTTSVTCRNGRPEQEAGLRYDPYADLPELNKDIVTCSTKTSGPIRITKAGDWKDNIEIKLVGSRQYGHVCGDQSVTISGTNVGMPNAVIIFDEGTELSIDDGSTVSAGSNNVMFYFARGSRPAINAPNSKIVLAAFGGESRILFRGARDNVLPIGVWNDIIIGEGSRLPGVIYFPASGVRFQGSGDLGSCPQIIGASIWLEGTWQINGPCEPVGTRPIVASWAVRLTQ